MGSANATAAYGNATFGQAAVGAMPIGTVPYRSRNLALRFGYMLLAIGVFLSGHAVLKLGGLNPDPHPFP